MSIFLGPSLFVKGRQGQKIVTAKAQQELMVAAAHIKEFTHFLTWAPDPTKALDHFDQFLDQLLKDRLPKKKIIWLTRKDSLANLAQLFGTSDFVWEDLLRRQHTNLLPIIENFHTQSGHPSKEQLAETLRARLGKTKNPETRKAILNQFKDEELFRIDMNHILQSTSLSIFSQVLTTLAEVILDQALLEAQSVVNQSRKPPPTNNDQSLPVTICGLGKLGGRELGYASDIEIVCIYDMDPHTPPHQRQSLENITNDWFRNFCIGLKPNRKVFFKLILGFDRMGRKGSSRIHWNRFNTITMWRVGLHPLSAKLGSNSDMWLETRFSAVTLKRIEMNLCTVQNPGLSIQPYTYDTVRFVSLSLMVRFM
jgi:hypothetical protein